MTLAPSARGLIDLLDQLGVPPYEKMTPVECRDAMAALRDPNAAVVPVAKATEDHVAGVPVRIYAPEGEGPFPVLVWIHGGGWVIGSAEQADPTARELCTRAECVVVSVDYRLAPEDPFPAGVDDVLAVTDAIGDLAASLGGDPSRIAVGGDSAGGNLSAIATQQRPGAFGYQVLVYPSVDMTFGFPSVAENGEGYLLTRGALDWFRGHYLDHLDEVDLRDPRISPLYAPDDVVAAVPPALVLTAGYDPLRDEGRAYVERLTACRVDAQLVEFPDQIHAFFTLQAVIPEAYDAIDRVAGALRAHWGT